MSKGKLKLDEKVSAMEAAYILKTSKHMEERGYKMLSYYPDMEMDTEGNKSVKGATMLYSHPKEDSYLHLGIDATPEGDVTHVGYFMTMGDWSIVQEDLISMSKEMVKFSKSRSKKED